MRLACVTTCRGRTNHLAVTLPQNLAGRGSEYQSVFVVLDYNDKDGLADYIQREHKKDLDSGALVYYRNTTAPRFHMAHAKNQAHRCGLLEGAAMLVNVDADNFTGIGFTDYLMHRFQEAEEAHEPIFLGARGNHRGPGNLIHLRTPPGCFGRIAVTTDTFRQAGGYDEIFSTWSPDDKDFGARILNLGYGWRRIHPNFLHAIRHKDGLRFKEYKQCYFDEVATLEKRAHLRTVNNGRVGTGIVYRNFSKEPIELKPIPTRVFGIGLHKTGTTSLVQAFRRMGLDAAHWESAHWARYIWEEMCAEGQSRTLEMHYALSDLPIPLLYKELDRGYPGSKFILTIRDEDTWLNSVRTHWTTRQHWRGDVFSETIHTALYGTPEFNESVFRERYRRHNAEVREYFKGRDDLLVLEIHEETGMAQLCRFLNMPVLNQRFPHKHNSSEEEKYRR